MWNEQFEEILRSHLPFLAKEQEIQEDDDLRDLGLDSMGMVGLIADLESGLSIRFADDMMRMENFATPGTLWRGLAALIPA
ncbi:phosphopantetheine-binding protein [Streptomyces tendae]|uniref:phosphopantetheine-binding protein n=1 Tax=Streptomyces TaxID=1883 RepID=UPI002FDBB4E5